MADVKISGLPASTTPLAGTEVLPVVQGGVTKQVSVANLSAGRAISATTIQSTVATGTAPLTVASTTEVANLRAANATSADTANQVKSNATTGVLQVVGPAAAATRVMTAPDANFTVARTDAAQTFTGNQTVAGTLVASIFNTASGTTGSIANAGSDDLITNAPNKSHYIVSANAVGNTTVFCSYQIYFDGGGTGTATVIKSVALTISSSGANKITVTNLSGASQSVEWTITRLK
jgi:hypothetical protein